MRNDIRIAYCKFGNVESCVLGNHICVCSYQVGCTFRALLEKYNVEHTSNHKLLHSFIIYPLWIGVMTSIEIYKINNWIQGSLGGGLCSELFILKSNLTCSFYCVLIGSFVSCLTLLFNFRLVIILSKLDCGTAWHSMLWNSYWGHLSTSWTPWCH